ncbi:MAG: hypothetical protein IKR59_02555, partial [Lachnospiraceae bacterium]|nr:hypothetical protein [Lachnospiraceae bacterium]
VQNWNDGKTQEFKDRKVYDIGASRLIRRRADAVAAARDEKVSEAREAELNKEFPTPAAAQDAAPEKEAPKTGTGAAIRLFATTTCPNCKIIAAQMDRMGIPYEKIYANEHPEEARALGIRQAPTLVVDRDGEIVKYTNVSEIKKFLAQLPVEA